MNAESEIAKCCARDVDRALIGIIEAIEGRVPSNAEIARYGHRLSFIHAGRSVWQWRGRDILLVEYFPEPGLAYRITPIQSVPPAL